MPAGGPLRIALIGCGHVAQFHLAAWKRQPGASVVAVADVDPSRADSRAAEFGVPAVYTDFRVMLDRERPDAVDICAGPAMHLEMVREAAARGIPISCQKPLAETLEDAREAVRLAEAAGVRLFVHENWRWRPWFREIRAVLDSGVLGTIHYCHYGARIAGTVPTPEHPEGFSLSRQPFFRTMKRFLLFESGIHMLDVCRYLFGEPRSIYAQTRHVSPLIAAEAVVTAVINFPAALVGCERSYAALGRGAPSVSDEEMVMEGGRGTLFLDGTGAIRVVEEDASRRSERRIPAPAGDAYRDSYFAAQRHFLDCLKSGAAFETDGPDNLRTFSLMLAGYESAESNRVVELYPQPAIGNPQSAHSGSFGSSM